MRLYICLVVFLVSVFSVTEAGVYRVDRELLDEVKQNHELLEEDKESNEYRFNLAMSYAYTGQIRKGWKILKEIPKSYSEVVIKTYEPLMSGGSELTEWRIPFRLAFGYFFADRKEDAIKMFEEVLKIDPDHEWAMGFISLVYGEMGETDRAIKCAKKAIKMEPHAPALHFLLAEGYRRKGKYLAFIAKMVTVGRLQTEASIRRPND